MTKVHNINESIIKLNHLHVVGDETVPHLCRVSRTNQRLRLFLQLFLLLGNVERTNVLPLGQRLIVDYYGVVSIFEEKHFFYLFVKLGLLYDLVQDGVDLELKGKSRTERAFPPWILGLRNESEVVLEVEALEVSAVDSSCWNLYLNCRQRTDKGYFD